MNSLEQFLADYLAGRIDADNFSCCFEAEWWDYDDGENLTDEEFVAYYELYGYATRFFGRSKTISADDVRAAAESAARAVGLLPGPPFVTAVRNVPADPRNEDRVTILRMPDDVVIAVADGAGGTGGGARAAEVALGTVRRSITDHRFDRGALEEALLDVDGNLDGAETTLVVARLHPGGIEGLAIGDSEAWVIGADKIHLTANVPRKPLLGSGEAVPAHFAFPPLATDATLVVGSDGLFKYVKPDVINRLARGVDVFEAAKALADAARLPNGDLQDDLSVVLCRRVSTL